MVDTSNEQTITVSKKQLYCALLQLVCLAQNANHGRIGGPYDACAVCKINPHMGDEGICRDIFEHTDPLVIGAGLRSYGLVLELNQVQQVH